MWPHRLQPTRLPHPWDSPGKNTGVGCHFLLQWSKYLLILWLQSLSAVTLETKKIKSASFHFFPFYLLWSDGTRCHDLRFLMWVSRQLFHSPLSSSSRDSSVPLHFLQSGIICISEIVDISPRKLDSSLWFIQPSISHDVLWIEVKEAGWWHTSLMHSFLNFELVHCSIQGSNCCFLTCTQVSQDR